ncbi:MAG: hypothetical protein IMZ58_08350 [Thermoplasmata archaeon]|nr:hypothetical protein [Thermoplasmata archaeon]
MIVVHSSVRTNKQFTPDFRKNQALGTIDEYGNPFRIIKLRWNRTRLHKNSDYTKTKGFEDAIIKRGTKDGGFNIVYRYGSVQWMQLGGEGPFYGELAQTPKNMEKLASAYGDKLWSIVDPDIEQIVKKMYEGRRKSMSEDVRQINDSRIRLMHVSEAEKGDILKGAVQLPPDVEQASANEQRRLNEIEKQNIEKRKAILDLKEEEVNKKAVDLVGDGVAAVAYTKDYLTGLKGLQQLRKICRELKIKSELTDKKPDLVDKIMKKQVGEVEAAKEQMAGVIGGGLDD